MILIISDEDDYSTNDVIDWLIVKRKAFCRINRLDTFELKYLSIVEGKSDFEIVSSDKKIRMKLTDLTSYWYRRGYLNLTFNNISYLLEDELDDRLFCQSLNTYLVKEREIIVNYIYELLHKLNGFGRYSENETNKLTNLMIAVTVGLKIPGTIVSRHNKAILDFYKTTNNELITKSLHQTGGVFWGKQSLHGLTKVVSQDEIHKMNCSWVNYMQTRVKKKYELRIFYLDGKVFASAIFSQSNEKTRVDFRDYDKEKPNRVVPYVLPLIIENRVNEFMKIIGMKSGSLDLIVDQDNSYVFLEVNPIGQFAQVSIPCNYHIEEYIANYLINEKNQEEIFI